MDFRIADSFTDSLARLTSGEQKAAKTTAFDLQVNPAYPSLQLHKLDKARDPRFASVRVNDDLRIIVHRTARDMLLCYVGHHDAAYGWAERRKLEAHPTTGAAQLVEIRETVEEIKVPKFIEVEMPALKKPLFANASDETLLGFGVPAEWIADARSATEDSLFALVEHLPSEAAEALFELASGGKPQPKTRPQPAANPFEHPDAQRRFRLMPSIAELERALEFPWDKWTVFLHPLQRSLVERDYSGPARVAGSAGTGKTVVAVHRAVYLARRDTDARVLLATFSDPLASVLRMMLRRLIGNEPRLGERIDVQSMDAIGRRLYDRVIGPAKVADRGRIAELLRAAAAKSGNATFSERFLIAEWEQVVDAWQVATWEAYRDVPRLGRKTRLPEKMRAVLWSIFEAVWRELDRRGEITYAGLFARLAEKVALNAHPPFEYAVLDESQDASVAQLRFLAALGGARQNALFFTGDIGQRIFQQPFSWKALGVDVRGRSYTLRINYRTSHQIRAQADRLLGPELADVDGITEDRRGTTSTFNGPAPTVIVAPTVDGEVDAVREWLAM
ncbi:MAG: UvrD-helicase domain-containing protein, partial [Vulcanimicrobiaceae bacterium]